MRMRKSQTLAVWLFCLGCFVRVRGRGAFYGQAFTLKPLSAENRESFCEKVPYYAVIRMFR